MRERLFRVIHKLEDLGWVHDSDLVKALRQIAECGSQSLAEEVLEAFRHG